MFPTSGYFGMDMRMLCRMFVVNWANDLGGTSEPFCMQLAELQIWMNSEGLLGPDAKRGSLILDWTSVKSFVCSHARKGRFPGRNRTGGKSKRTWQQGCSVFRHMVFMVQLRSLCINLIIDLRIKQAPRCQRYIFR